MPKKKLTKKQLQEQSAIIEALTSAGWKRTKKGEVFRTANLEFQNDTMRLEVDYNPEKHSIYFSIYDDAGRSVDLIIYFNEKLKKLLDVITAFQHDISPSNYREAIRKILAVCASTYLDLGEETVQLIDDNVNSQLPDRE